VTAQIDDSLAEAKCREVLESAGNAVAVVVPFPMAAFGAGTFHIPDSYWGCSFA
jgi:hypothetical protein